jgi:glycosyltransferase involved in cell wall biosynthesis
MKVLLVHNFYQSSSPSGEDTVFTSESELLQKKGVEVITYERYNDDLRQGLRGLLRGFQSIWSKETYRDLKDLLRKERPDIAHFHNIWYLISPSGYAACREEGVPVVQTLHNFRMFCANGLLLRDGRVCEECAGKMPWRSVAYGCYRNSRLFSFPVAMAEAFHRVRGTWTDKIDAYIALTEFGKQKFVECGLPEERIFVKPNFFDGGMLRPGGDYGIFLGRLSSEKGIDVLIDALYNLKSAYPHNLKRFSFKVVGDGPLRTELEKQVEDKKLRGRVEFLGRKSRSDCMDLLSKAGFLVMPALCYENLPMAVVEAFACGKPVIASNLGAVASIIKDRETGLLFEPGNAEALAKAMMRLWEDEEACLVMGKKARAEFEAKYTADRNYEMLTDIYEKTIKRAKG